MALKNGRTTTSLQTVVIGSVIPTGTVQSFAGVTVPDGWLLCDGSAVSRTTYSALFEVISTLHGEGDATTTFHLPDYRGRFLRGADNMGTGAAGRDPGGRTNANAGGNVDGVGSVQADAMQGHYHNVGPYTNTTSTSNNQSIPKWSALGGVTTSSTGVASIVRTDGVNGTPRTSGESRPQNSNVSWVIKV
jgi:microcystin-dependent protein